MQRAAVLIGVSKTESLPALQAVESGIAQMRAWAEDQGIVGDRLVELTDQNTEVRAYQVVDAIKALVERRDLDQLIVYFSGHGLYNCGDIWLLSGAPRLSSEAVNVEGSIQAARVCGVSRVVIISDACRVAPDGIQALGVKGIDIFPNDPVDGMERPVDVYFACARGMPALEVRDASEAARRFSGIYTDVLVECLVGEHADALEVTEEAGAKVAQVRTLKLAAKLQAEVPLRLKARLGKTPTVNQTPVARVDAYQGWISRLPLSRLPAPPEKAIAVLGRSIGMHTNAVDAADQLLRSILSGQIDVLDSGMLGSAAEQDAGSALLLSVAADLAAPPRPLPRHIRCGVRLRGAQVRAVHGNTVRYAITDAQARLVDIDPGAAPTSVLLEIDDGSSVLVPIIPGFIAELRFRQGELAHMAYEPAVPPDTWGDAFAEQRTAVRVLLGAVAAAAGMGVLRLDMPTLMRLERVLDHSAQPDPSLALYTAYAYHDSGWRHDILSLWGMQRDRLGFTFYDLPLLAGNGSPPYARGSVKILPAIPMQSRGWSLLKVFGATIPPLFEELQAYLRPSFWTLFNSTGTERLVEAINNGRIPL
jgi:hypothetical protein